MSLGALGKASSEIRNKLGESLSTVKKFDTPLEQATSSLETLQAYSLGWKTMVEDNSAIEINRNNPSKTIELLETVSPYELGAIDGLYSVYLRGLAYLLLRQGNEAATEFQKISDHRGVVGNEHIGALARLGLARAYVLQGDTTKARAVYQDFLTLWKDADPDIPILKEAKAEYAKLQ